MNKRTPSVSLVLGSGGARGHAHIGVIHAIEERELEIRNIAGTSMGAVIGGIYAAKKLKTYEAWAYRLQRKDVLQLLDFSFTWSSIFKGERIIEVLQNLIGDRQIEDLETGFTAVATALDEQREVWLNKGSLFRAIRASTAVPGIFAPVSDNGRLLVDGGLINPVPIAPTLNDATDLTIAVNLSGFAEHYRPDVEKAGNSDVHDADDDSYRAAISRFIGGLLDSGKDEQPPSDPDVAALLTKSIDAMQSSIARLKLAAYAPDLVIDIPRDACTFFEFQRAEEMAELGYRKATGVLDEAGL